MNRITLKWLKKNMACSEAQELFNEIFGQSASVQEVVQELHERKLSGWEAWLLAQTPSLTKSLLQYGADVHARNDVALGLATLYGHTETVALLKAHIRKTKV